jgi:hypothetical protein
MTEIKPYIGGTPRSGFENHPGLVGAKLAHFVNPDLGVPDI